VSNSIEKYQQLRRELRSFIIIGIAATLIDFTLYSIFQHFIVYSIAKTCSFLCGTTFTYLLNKFFTFKQTKHSNKEVLKFATLYSLSLIANVSVNSAVIHILKTYFSSFAFLTHPVVIIVAFVSATGVSTIINFTGQKLWVFKKKAS
jgi:putative flippase GtrA